MVHKFARNPRKTRKVWIKPITPKPSLSPPPTTSDPVLHDDREGNSDQEPWEELPELVSQTDDSGNDSDSEPSSTHHEIPKATFKYKKVSLKVRPVAVQMPENLQPQRQFPEDPLLNLPILPFHPPQFIPTTKFSAERMEQLGIEKHEELWPEEWKLLQHILQLNERSIAFNECKRGTFCRDCFSDYIIPTIPHEPWTEKNRCIAHGYKDEVI